jgi:hypothetical protein
MKPVAFIATGFIFEIEFILSKDGNANGEGRQDQGRVVATFGGTAVPHHP